MFPDGTEVVVNTGGPDCLAVVQSRSYWNAALEALRPVCVKFPTGTQFIPREAVRRATLADHARVFGLRFSDWQYQLYYTLLFYYLRTFDDLDRAELAVWWREGWTAGATAKRLAQRGSWVVISTNPTVPRHLRGYVQDLGFAQEAASDRGA